LFVILTAPQGHSALTRFCAGDVLRTALAAALPGLAGR
jgi:hypothetical protein